MMGAPLDTGRNLDEVILDLATSALSGGICSSVLVPVRTPSGDHTWSLVTDPLKLAKAVPVQPVMTVNGARVLSSFAREGGEVSILAILRPCEARAAVELAKLEQLDLQHVTMLTFDCPGSVPLKSWRGDRELLPDRSNPGTLRPLCRQCTSFTGEGDLCVADHGGSRLLIPFSDRGGALMKTLGLEASDDASAWIGWADGLRAENEAVAESMRADLMKAYSGLEGLTEMFSGCIGCRSCRTVCPICYCRLCFIDMKDRRYPASEHLRRSEKAGAARLTSGTLLFHIGRMAHMSLSCVSCGMCEDACPSDIPIGRMVSLVSGSTTALLGYRAGSDRNGPPPLNTFEKDELHEFEY